MRILQETPLPKEEQLFQSRDKLHKGAIDNVRKTARPLHPPRCHQAKSLISSDAQRNSIQFIKKALKAISGICCKTLGDLEMA